VLALSRYERVSGNEFPIMAWSVLQSNDGSSKGVEAPETSDGSGDGGVVAGGCGSDTYRLRLFSCRLVACIFGAQAGGFCFGERVERKRFTRRGVGENEASAEGIGSERDNGFTTGTFKVQDEVVGEGGGEDKWSTFYRENHRGPEEAGDCFGVGRAERRRHGCLDGRQANDDDGLGVVEGWWGVEAQIERFVAGEGDGGDVLIFGGMETAHKADEVDDCSDIGAVKACARH